MHNPSRTGAYQADLQSSFSREQKCTYKNEKDNASDIFKEAEEWTKYFVEQFKVSIPDKLFDNTYECSNIGRLTQNMKCDTRDPERDIDEPVIPDWRRDRMPKGVKSMSDWTLKVYDGAASKIYELHKNVLTYGPRRSMYFIKEFEKQNQKAAATSHRGTGSNGNLGVSEVALPKRVAECMPQFLDYVYRDEFNPSTRDAAALKFLANYFDVRQLFTSIIAFIEKDLHQKTAPVYIMEADSIKDKDLTNAALKVAAESFATGPDTYFFSLSPNLFQRLVTHSCVTCNSELLSEKIAAYIREHRSEINDESFFLLTNANILPRISPSEAFWYLSYGSECFKGILSDESFGGPKASLKKRCAVAVSTNWRGSLLNVISSINDFGGSSRKFEESQAYRNLPPDIRIELLESSLLAAGSESRFGDERSGQDFGCASEFRDDANIATPLRDNRAVKMKNRYI